jgi:hypothetical protein
MMAPMASKPPPKKRSLYDILGVPRDAMAIDIGMAYKKRLAELDRKPDADPNEVALVREAYHILCQPREREAYDSSLITREEREEARSHVTDIVLETDEEPSGKRPPLWMWIAGGVALLAILAFFLMRPTASERGKIAAKEAAAEEAARTPPPPPPPPPPKTRSAQEVFGLVTPGIARITAYDVSGKPVPIGSGIVFAPDGIVTTCHDLPPSATIVARVGVEALGANLLIFDEDLNLCRLSVGANSGTPIAASAEEPKAGDVVNAVAQHKGSELSVVQGTVKGVRTAPAGKLIEISMPVTPSASGGGLFDAYGRLIGVLTSRSTGMNAAIPASAIAQMRTRGQPAPKP